MSKTRTVESVAHRAWAQWTSLAPLFFVNLEGMELTETTATPETAENETALAETATNGQHEHTHDHSHDHQHGPALNPELTREIEVEVSADEVAKSFKTVVKRYQKLARIPGFRSGKVPESLVRSKFAKEVRQEVMEMLVSDRFRKAIDEQKLQPVSEPQLIDLQLEDGKPLKFKAGFEVRPEFDIAGYDAVTITKPDVALSEEEYDAELARVLDGYATVEAVEEERPLVDGDWAEITFKGEVKNLAQTVTEDGLASTSDADSEPITGEDVLIEVGGKNTLAAFNEALRGSKPGQELTFEVVYPADFGERKLAGQTVSYDVTVKAIKKKTFPEKDTEFAKQLGNYESFEEFEGKLREHASQQKKDALESRVKDQMLEQLIAKYQFPVPESFVQQQVDARLDRGLRALAQQGMQAEDMRKLDFGRLRAAQRDQAINEVKASMILDRVAEAENITVDEEELDRELLMLSIQSREPLETLRERLSKDGGLDRIREQMRREKTGSVLYEKLSA
ncbi:MAG: trigger factor [Acidobacteriaceae bacterium]|nr:trigger factor [Acidobacteriaceae bacterium]